MLLGNNNDNPTTRQKVNALLGKPYSLLERLKHQPVECKGLQVVDASKELEVCLGNDDQPHFIDLELRPMGVLVHLQNAVDKHVWAIPYYRLSVYQSDTFNLHGNGWRIRLYKESVYPANHDFMSKLMEQRAAFSGAAPFE